MNRILPILMSGALCVAGHAQNNDEKLSDEFRKQSGHVETALKGILSRLSNTSESLNKLKERTDGLEEDQSRIVAVEKLCAEAQKASQDALKLAVDVQSIKKSVADDNASIEEIKKHVEKLQTQSESVNALDSRAQRLSMAVEEFKAYTAMARAGVRVGCQGEPAG